LMLLSFSFTRFSPLYMAIFVRRFAAVHSRSLNEREQCVKM
jgi:hypothetical protein